MKTAPERLQPSPSNNLNTSPTKQDPTVEENAPTGPRSGTGLRFSLRMAFFWITVFGIVLAYFNAFDIAPRSQERVLFKESVGSETFIVREVPIAKGMKARMCYATIQNSYREVVAEKSIVIDGSFEFEQKRNTFGTLSITLSNQSDPSIQAIASFKSTGRRVQLITTRVTDE